MGKTILFAILIFLFCNPAKAQTTNPSKLVPMNGLVYYTTTTSTYGQELWKTDGSACGTVMVKDIRSGVNGSSPRYLTAIGNTLYFVADDGIHGEEIWKTDGTEAGTVMVKDIIAGPGSTGPKSLAALNGKLYFTASDPDLGVELWRSDGTAAGTYLLKDLSPGYSSGKPQYYTVMDSTLYFEATNSLWKTDGTEAGTAIVKDIYRFDELAEMVAVGKLLFFELPITEGRELWKSDGTEAGTAIVKDIRFGSEGSFPSDFAVQGNTLFFTADDGIHGRELWKTDGSDSGTQMVSDGWPGISGSIPSNTKAMGGHVYYAAYEPINDQELWKSDGTATGTVRVKNINPTGTSSAVYLTAVGNTLYFGAMDGSTGMELYKTDGTSAGTVRVKDLSAGSGFPQDLTPVGNILFFTAFDGSTNREIWFTTGTEAGTIRVKDLLTPTILTGSAPLFSCAGSAFNLPYSALCNFNSGNIFTAQLSDASGSFASPVTIGTLASASSGTINVTIPSSTPVGPGYRLRVISSSPSVTGFDNGINLNINAPLANITASATYLCTGGSLQLNASPAASFQWKKDGAVLTGAINQTYSATTSGNYIVAVTDSTGCSASSAVYTVNQYPLTTITSHPANISTCASSTANFSITALGNSMAYQWKKNGVTIPGATSNNYIIAPVTAGDAASYNVEVTGLCGSDTSDVATLTVNTCTYLSNLNSDITEAILIPNPVRGKTMLRMTVRKTMMFEMKISDETGRALLTQRKQLSPGRNLIEWDLQNLPAGNYYISGKNQWGLMEIIKVIKL